MSKPLKIILGVVIIAILVFFVVRGDSKNKLGGVEFYAINGNLVATSTIKQLVNNSITQVFSVEPAAQFRCLGNASGSAPIFLAFGTSTGLGLGKGFPLQPSSTEYFFGDSLWRGGIWAWSEATATVSLCQL